MTKKSYLKNVPVFSDIEVIEKCSKYKRPYIHKRPVPQKKICEECKIKRVKNHHYCCDTCWKKKHFPKKEENVKEF